jgi:hypothetical protein
MSAARPILKAPSLPQVNLIPPEVATHRSRGRMRVRAGIAVILVVVALADLFAVAFMRRTSAEATLARSQERTAELNAQIESLSYIPVLEAQRDNARSALQYAASTEFVWATIADEVKSRLPAGAVNTKISYALPGIDAYTGADPNPLGVSDIGSVDVEFQVNDHPDIIALQEAYADLPGLARPRVTVVERTTAETAGGDPTTAADDTEVATRIIYAVTINFRATYDLLDHRFSDSWTGIDGAPGTEAEVRELMVALREGMGISQKGPLTPLADRPVPVAPAPAGAEDGAGKP